MDSKTLYEKSMDGPILYIRHGKTEYNQLCKHTPKDQARTKVEYLDCPLNSEGILQAEEISKNIRNMRVKKVFCSPLYRCLETCLAALKDHPESKNVQVVVHPFISEVISGVHDFSRKIRMKMEKFNENSEIKFDWSLFDSYYSDENSKENYFVNFIDVTNEDESLKKLVASIKLENSEESDKLIAEIIQKFWNQKKRPEPLKHIFNRNLEFKKHLKQLELEENEKVLVFTHSVFIQMSTSKLAYALESIDAIPEDCYRADNCEIITMKII